MPANAFSAAAPEQIQELRISAASAMEKGITRRSLAEKNAKNVTERVI